MGQKSNPISLRLEKTNKSWSSCWYGDFYYAKQLIQVLKMDTYIKGVFNQAKMHQPLMLFKGGGQQMQIALLFSKKKSLHRFPLVSRESLQGNPRGVRSQGGGENKGGTLAFFQSSPLPLTKGRGSVAKAMASPPALSLQPSFPLEAGSFERVDGMPSSSGGCLLGKTTADSGIEGMLFLIRYILLGLFTSQWQTKKRDVSSNFVRKEFYFGKIAPKATNSLHMTSYLGESPRELIHLFLSSFPEKYAAAPAGGTTLHRSAGDMNLFSDISFALNWQGPSAGFLRKKESMHSIPQLRELATHLPRTSPWNRSVKPIFLQQKARLFPLNHMEWCIHRQLFSMVKIYPLVVPSLTSSPWENPHFLAAQIVDSLQERVPFRRLKDKIIRDIKDKVVIKGIRISCSGRVAARSKKAQKAKTESIQWGQTSLHVFSESLSFASKSAFTPYGKIGVKVWICYR